VILGVVPKKVKIQLYFKFLSLIRILRSLFGQKSFHLKTIEEVSNNKEIIRSFSKLFQFLCSNLHSRLA
jgi:hypothetical protein